MLLFTLHLCRYGVDDLIYQWPSVSWLNCNWCQIISSCYRHNGVLFIQNLSTIFGVFKDMVACPIPKISLTRYWTITHSVGRELAKAAKTFPKHSYMHCCVHDRSFRTHPLYLIWFIATSQYVFAGMDVMLKWSNEFLALAFDMLATHKKEFVFYLVNKRGLFVWIILLDLAFIIALVFGVWLCRATSTMLCWNPPFIVANIRHRKCVRSRTVCYYCTSARSYMARG